MTTLPEDQCLFGISPKAYEHPADRAATAVLKSVPMLDVVVRRLIEYGYERALRQALLASAVRSGKPMIVLNSSTIEVPGARGDDLGAVGGTTTGSSPASSARTTRLPTRARRRETPSSSTQSASGGSSARPAPGWRTPATASRRRRSGSRSGCEAAAPRPEPYASGA